MYNIYKINDNKFKSIYLSVNFTIGFKQEEASEIAILSSLLKKVNKEYGTEREIEIYLSSLYGAVFDIGVEKIGDLYNLEFKINFLNKNFIPTNEDVFQKCLEFIYCIIYNPKFEKDEFNKNIVDKERDYLIEKINERKDDKLKYAVLRTEELIAKDDPFGIFVLGREEDAKNITGKAEYNRYLKIIKEASVSVIISGNLDGYNDISKNIHEIFDDKLAENPDYILLKEKMKINLSEKNTEEVLEKAQTTQSVITMGLRIANHKISDFYTAYVYNVILGGTPSSKLFRNFREKESLAYTVKSRYYRYKGIVIIYAGIENKNYEKAKDCILKQLKSIEESNVSFAEFQAAKDSIKADLKEISDSNIALTKNLYGNLFSYFNNNYGIEDMINNFDLVTLEDVIKFASRVELQQIYLLGGAEDAEV